MTEQRSSSSFYHPKVNSYAYGASLYREITTLNVNMVYQCFNEQRKYPRFKPDTKIFILHSTLGTVQDIGIGGLSYTYYHLPKESSKILPKVGAIFCAANHYLLEVPCAVVSDTVVRNSYSCLPELKQRRISFSGLTQKQLKMLEPFILTHAVVPQLNSEEAIHPADTGRCDHTV